MTITKPTKKLTADVDAFIAAAPDSTAATPAASALGQPKYVRKGKKLQITLTIAQPLLERVDELAREAGQSRAAIINLAIFKALENDLLR